MYIKFYISKVFAFFNFCPFFSNRILSHYIKNNFLTFFTIVSSLTPTITSYINLRFFFNHSFFSDCVLTTTITISIYLRFFSIFFHVLTHHLFVDCKGEIFFVFNHHNNNNLLIYENFFPSCVLTSTFFFLSLFTIKTKNK